MARGIPKLSPTSRRVVYRTLGGVGVVFGLLGIGALRWHSLRAAAAQDWMRRTSSSLHTGGTSVRAWAAEQEAALRLLGASAGREPALFRGAAAIRPPITPDSLSRRVAGALTQLNQVSRAPGGGFDELWVMDPSGGVATSATPNKPPSLVTDAVLAAVRTDSTMIVGPFPSAKDKFTIAFIQPVVPTAGSPAAAGVPRRVVGAVVLQTTVDAATLPSLGVIPPGVAREPTALVVQVRDSIYEYSLRRPGAGPAGIVVRSWLTSAAPPSERAALDAGASGSVMDPLGPSATARIDGLPWGLIRHANTATLFSAADAEFVRDVAIASVLLTFMIWLALARRHAERERHLRGIAASEARYRLLADYSTDIIARHALDGRILYISPAVQTVLGYSPAQLEGTDPIDLRHPDDVDATHTAIHRALSLDDAVRTEHRFRHADGHYVWLETMGRALRDPNTGAISEFITTSRDIVDAKQAEEALRFSEEQYRLLFESNPMPMWTFDVMTGKFLAVNDAAVAHYGYSREEFLRMTVFDIRPPEYSGEVLSVAERMRGGLRQLPHRHHRKKDGTIIEVDLTVHLLPLSGNPTRLVLINDVTEKRKIEAALHESSEFVRAVLDSSPVAIVATDLNLCVVQWNRAAERLFGWRANEVMGRRSPVMMSEAGMSSLEQLRDALLHTGQLTGRHRELARKDGTRIDVDLSLGVIHNASGSPAGFVGLAVDLTERTRLEAQLRQAQKMEAVGQLAGGVAHDFNNLLTVITTYAELLLSDLTDDESARADLMEIKGAGERAAALTRQLLAFSRQQVLEPRLVDLNVVVGGIEQMLRRVLPSTIHVVTQLDPALGSVYADPGQIEQVLMNLVVNARDAMPDGGILTLQTANVEVPSSPGPMRAETDAGSYVTLTVSDTGCGMPREVQERIFEPFFTTKEVGKGTGLGLSTAHGIVSQSGGYLAVRSMPDVGTTFTMYLRRASEDIAANVAAPAGVVPSGRIGADVVLLVEDEAAVRVAATRILERAGYTVLVAADGPEALAMYAQHGSNIDIVLTDMLMPNMSGAALAKALHAQVPTLPIVFMSGFADDSLIERGTDNRPVVLLRKPFAPDVLERAVRDALRSSNRAQAGGDDDER